MKKFICIAVLLAMAACVQAALNTPAVVNPSFEDPDVAAGVSEKIITDWFDSIGYTYTTDDAAATHPDTPYGENWSEFGQRRWMYQQIGTYEENMVLDISFLMGARSDKDPSPAVVVLLVGGDPGLAADLNTQFYVADFGTSTNPLVGIVGASLIATSGEIAPFSSIGMATSEQTVMLSTGTGHTVGDPLWVQVYCPITVGGRLLIDNVAVEYSTATILVGPDNNEPRADVNTDLEWSAPPVGVVDHYVLYYRNDPNFAAAGTTVVDPATSPYDMGTMPFATEYFWRVDIVDDGAQTITGKVWSFTTAPEIPQIDVQPMGVLVPGDGSADAVFTVSGLNIVNFAWEKDGAPLANGGNIAGADTDTLTVIGATLADEGMYSCVVDNGKGDTDETTAAILMTERMLAHFEFENDLTDSTGNLNTGVVIDPNTAAENTDAAAVDFDAGIVGSGALSLGANKDVEGYQLGFVEIPGSEDAFRSNHLGLTVSTWIKCPGIEIYNYYYPTIVRVQYDDTDEVDPDNTNSSFVLNRYYGRANFLNGGITARALVPDEIEPDVRDTEWHFMTGVYERSYDQVEEAWTGVTRIYVDGVLRSETTGLAGEPDLDNLGTLLLGARRISSIGLAEQAHVGLIDDVRIYSYPLDAITIAGMYTTVTPEDDYICLDAEGLEYDLNGDCIVDIADLAQFAGTWLNCRRVPDCVE